MQSPEFEALVAQADRTQKLLWTVLTVSILLYGAVAWVAAPEAPNPTLAGTLRPILFVVAAGLAATSALLFRRRQAQSVPGSTTPQGDDPPSPLLRARTENLPPREQRALAAMTRGFNLWIVCLVMNEAIAILGLLLAFLAGGPEAVAPFVLLAIVLNLTMRPDARRRAEAALSGVG